MNTTRKWLGSWVAGSLLIAAGVAEAAPRERTYDRRGQGRGATYNAPTAYGHGRIRTSQPAPRPAFSQGRLSRPTFVQPRGHRPVIARPHVVQPSRVRPFATRPYIRPWIVQRPVRPYVLMAHHRGFFERMRALRASAVYYLQPHYYSIDQRVSELSRLEAEVAAIQAGSGWVTSYPDYQSLVRAILDLRASLGGYAPAPTVNLAMY